MLTCSICNQPFAPTPPTNPGTTYIAGYADDPERVETLCICNSCLPSFYAQDVDEQHALAASAQSKKQ